MYAQDTVQYFLEIKEGHELGTVSKTNNPDNTLQLSMANASLATLLNSKSLTKFEKAFPGVQRPKLSRTYIIELPFESTIGDLSTRQEVQNLEVIPYEEPELLDDFSPSITILPNDYEDIVYGGRNKELDLIKAPLAWTITNGEGILVGVSDNKIDTNHEDIGNNIIILPNSPTTGSHGTGVASKIAALTNNGKGVSSLAYGVDILSWNYISLHNGVHELAQIPGVKVINCSWRICSYSDYYEEMYNYIAEELGVLVVAGAANGPNGTGCGNGYDYAYPASYTSTISVTSVGSKQDIGDLSGIQVPGSNPPEYYWQMSWKDVHEFRPHTPNTASHTHNDKVDVTAPGIWVTTASSHPDNPNGYIMGMGTSGAAPFVSALAAMIFSINPNFTPQEVKDIIRNTADDIYHIPYNHPYVGLLGTRRINAFRAVKTADCITNPDNSFDLGMQDTLEDYFYEPNNNNSNVFWHSPDVFVRNQNDGKIIPVHENPEYSPNNPVYAYVRVTNNSCVSTFSSQNKVKLYWSKANTALAWPQHWNGTLYITDPQTNQQVLMGDEVGEAVIPPLGPGESVLLEFPWMLPNPADYHNINYNPWHFCLLARIDTPNDPMSFAETSNLAHNIVKNNNIVMKNTTVVDIEPDTTNPQPVGGVVAVGNPDTVANTFDLQLFPEANEAGKALYEEAEITITLDDILYNAWDNGGRQLEGGIEIRPKIIRATNGNASIKNINLPANAMGTAYVSFNFLTDELTPKSYFTYHLGQKKSADTTYIGGETFLVSKQQRDTFSADAGNDDEVQRNQSITLTASQINEGATYNWYDPQGNLVHTGSSMTVTPQLTQTYKLEVVADVDGFKDYDNVTVTVNPYRIETLNPNPTSSMVTVDYLIDGATSAYLMMVNIQTGSCENIILDTTTSQLLLDVTNLSTGLYNIILVCDGEVQNSKTLAKN